MSVKNDGGPAFPVVTSSAPDFDGMTLRDYFAAKALPWFAENSAADSVKGLTWQQVAARGTYELADAMLAARGTA